MCIRDSSLAVGCQNEAVNVLPSRVFSERSVTNHESLLYYCDAPLLAPKWRHCSLCCMEAIPAFQCLCLQQLQTTTWLAVSIKISKCLPWYRNMESRWTLSMKNLTTVNQVADDIFVFQQDHALVHHACKTSNCWNANSQLHFNYGPPFSSSAANPTHINLRDLASV